MTKKDYIKIAEVLRIARERSKDKEVIRHIITELIKVFKEDNELFNEKKFESAIYN